MKYLKSSLFLFGIIVALIVTLPTGLVVGGEGPFGGIKEKMMSVSEAERQNLQNLFVLGQQIEELEKEEDKITHYLVIKHGEIEGMKVKIAQEEITYQQKLEDLKQVLKSYQRMGPGTYLEIILNSDNLTTLLRRINTLRDLTRNTGKLIALVEESKEKQLAEKTNLAKQINLLEDQQKQLRESLTKKKQLIEDQENYLASLQEERESYEETLANLQQNWKELKVTVPELIKELSTIIAEGNIPADKVTISYNLRSIKGAIDQQTFNEIVSGYDSLPKIVFSFSPCGVEVNIPDKNLVLVGKFVVEKEHTIKFQVQGGSFYELPLDTRAIEELFLKGNLVFNLELPIGNFTIYSLKTTEGYLELTITLNTEEVHE